MKFTKKDIRKVLKGLKLDKQVKLFIERGIIFCIDNDINHLDLVMTKVYRQLETEFGDDAKNIKSIIYKDIKRITEEDLFTETGITGRISNRKLFMILLERYGM